MKYIKLSQCICCVLVLMTAIPLSAQVNIEQQRKDADSIGFTTTLGLDFSIWTGNTNVQLLTGKGRFNYNGGSYYSFLLFKGEYGWNDGKQFSNGGLVHLRFVDDITEHFYLEYFGQADYNKERRLLSRGLGGIGGRFKIYTSTELKARLGIGAMYENEKYDLPPDAIHPLQTRLMRSTNYLGLQIEINKTSHLTSTTYYQPAFRDMRDYRILSESTLTIILGQYLDLNITFNLRHDNNPPDNTKPTDTFTEFGLGVKL